MPARNTTWKIGAVLAVLLVLSGAYLWAFKSATLIYMSSVLMHVLWGIVLLPFAFVLLRKAEGRSRRRCCSSFPAPSESI